MKKPGGETLIMTQIKTLILTLMFSFRIICFFEHGNHGIIEILMFQLMS